MARAELQQLGLRKAAASYRQAWRSVSAEKGIPQPLRGLDVARRFVREQAGDTSGILLDLGLLRTILRTPPAVAVITDPKTAADLLRHDDFSGLSSEHAIYQAFRPFVGNYLVYQNTKAGWLDDRRAAALPYSKQEVDPQEAQQISSDALESVIGLGSSNEFPRNWIKYLTVYQVVRHSTGHEVDPTILADAMEAHSKYTGRTIREVIIGNSPRTIGRILAYPTMRRYYRLQHEIAAREPAGRLKKVMDNLPQHRRDTADIAATLIGGLSTTRSYIQNTLYVLARNPDLQTKALQDPSFLRRVVQETARAYPAAPYILRKAARDLKLGNTTIPAGSLVVFGIFAYGTNPEISDPNRFDPSREDLEEMASSQGGAANVFSYGPRACLGKHVGVQIVESTARAILQRYDIRLLNNPVLTIGKGIGSSFDRPVQFQLIDRLTKVPISATSK